MLLPVLIILWFYLIVGLVGIFNVNRKRPRADGLRLWLKFGTYAAIIHVILLSMAWQSGWLWHGIAVSIVATGLFEIVRLNGRHRPPRPAVMWIGVAVYLAVAAGFIGFAWRVPIAWQLAIYLVVCVFDGFSQLSGQMLGRHKLAPTISPAKTIEGFLGGLVMAMITGGILGHFAGFSLPAALALAAGLSLVALCGDLAASCYKRRQGAKDFSGLIPGHGGILDRFDSALLAGAMVYVACLAVADNYGAWRTLLIALGFLIILGASELLRTMGVRGELTRKFTHSGGGLLALAIPALALSVWQVTVLGLSIAGLFVVGKRRDWFGSVDPAGRPQSLGSYCFPLGIGLSYVMFLKHGLHTWYYISVLVLVISVPLAWYVSIRWPAGRLKIFGQRKTLSGTAAFLASAFVIVMLILEWSVDGSIPWGGIIGQAGGIAVGAALAEALTPYGLDNVTIPAATLSLLYALAA